MSEASFSDVIEVILIILLIYFGFRILVRWFGPILLRYFLKKVSNQVAKKFGGTQGPQSAPKEPTLEKKPGRKRKSSKEVGEYIDYEEIE